MVEMIDSPFDLPENLQQKASESLIADDERHFATIRARLASEVAGVEAREDALRRQPARGGQTALERDLEIRRLSSRLHVLRRFGVDACLGRLVHDDGSTTYIGRFGLAGADGQRLLVDWRADAAKPFFAASPVEPMGVTSRRRYRWKGGRIVDYWDEVFVPDDVDRTAALEDDSAFIASLGARRSSRMRDVLATIQADQHAIVRAGSRGALVVEGGPGTGKTVVALHRAAYLLYSDPRLSAEAGEGGLLFIGPSRPYLAYIDDVLPSLGEEGALVAALGDLVTTERAPAIEADPLVRAIKADGRLMDAVEHAVRMWQRPPTRAGVIDTAWGGVRVGTADWAEIFEDAADAPHNVVRERAWERMLDLLADRIDGTIGEGEADHRWEEGWGDAGAALDEGTLDGDRSGEGEFDAYDLGGPPEGDVRSLLQNDDELHALFDRAWPLLDPDRLLRALWASPAMLRKCAPWLGDDEVAALAGARHSEWTDADLPHLDAARQLVGDPRAHLERKRARREAAVSDRLMREVTRDLIATDDSEMKVMSMLRGQDLRGVLDQPVITDADPLAGPFGHIVVDEAQELTDAQWRMLLRRCPSRSLTIVGDRAQARRGFTESWEERLARIGIDAVRVSTLTVGYRTPAEVMEAAESVIRSVLPDAIVPVSIRSTGIAVRRGAVEDLGDIVGDWLAANERGTVAVIGPSRMVASERVSVLTPELAKGLEFDLVVLVNPASLGGGITGAVDRYVAMTRATRELVLLE